MPKRALIPLKFEVIFNYDTFFQGGTKLPAWSKISPIDGMFTKAQGREFTIKIYEGMYDHVNSISAL